MTLIAIIAASFALVRQWPSVAAMFLPEGRRVKTIDGLRGALAISVVLHHAIYGRVIVITGHPGYIPSNFHNQLGSAAVAIFFMVSALLFCGKLKRSNGLLDVSKLAVDRCARIVPLYLLCVALVLFIAIAQQHFVLVNGPEKLARETLRLASFDFLKVYSLNNTRSYDYLGMRWTLRYEWLFYGCLPLLALLMRISRRYVAAVLTLGILTAWDARFAFFTTGAFAVILIEVRNPVFTTAMRILGALGLGLSLVLLHDSTGWITAVAYLPFLVAVAQGLPPYHVFASRSLRLLGEMSFSIYLVQGISGLILGLFVQFPSDQSFAVEVLSIFAWSGSAVLLATLTYLLVERPSMAWGRRTTQLLGRVASRQSEAA